MPSAKNKESGGTAADEHNAAVADPAPAEELKDSSGAVIEEEVVEAVDLEHAAIDANPRDGTTAEQNQIDMNDPKHRQPNAEDYVGQGLDPAPYGKVK